MQKGLPYQNGISCGCPHIRPRRGLTQFIKPPSHARLPEMGYEAGVKAMLDAKINYDVVETGIACYCYGDTTSDQRVFYKFGMSTIPIYNTNNACATGSTGLYLARTLVKNKTVDCVMVIGFERSIKSLAGSAKPCPTVNGDDGAYLWKAQYAAERAILCEYGKGIYGTVYLTHQSTAV
jgi:acetyl-CoA acetyltransferase